jgi:hypothetical protein
VSLEKSHITAVVQSERECPGGKFPEVLFVRRGISLYRTFNKKFLTVYVAVVFFRTNMNISEGFGKSGCDKRGGRKGGGNGGDDTQKGGKGGKKWKRKMLRNGNEYRHKIIWCRNLHGYCNHLEEDGYCMYAHTLEEWRNGNIANASSLMLSSDCDHLYFFLLHALCESDPKIQILY